MGIQFSAHELLSDTFKTKQCSFFLFMPPVLQALANGLLTQNSTADRITILLTAVTAVARQEKTLGDPTPVSKYST